MSNVPRLPKYSQLLHDEDDGETEQPTRLRTSIKTRYGMLVIALSLLAFCIILILSISLSIIITLMLPHILPNLSFSCGAPSQVHLTGLQAPSGYKAGTAQLCRKSPAEAEAAGCVFDLMTVSWLPLECYDGELTTKFMEEGPWNFYLSNSTKPEALPEERVQIPSLEAISKTTELMWTDRRFHVFHCIYGWKMMH